MPRLRGGQPLVPSVDGDVEPPREGIGEGLCTLSLRAPCAAEGEGEADDERLCVLLPGQLGHSLDGVGSGIDGRDGDSQAGAKIGGGDADTLLAGVYRQDATADGLRRHLRTGQELPHYVRHLFQRVRQLGWVFTAAGGHIGATAAAAADHRCHALYYVYSIETP